MEEVKLNETQQLLACADDVNLFGGGGVQNSTVTVQEVGQEINVDKPKYIFMPDYKNV